jgi:hypothetical protein
VAPNFFLFSHPRFPTAQNIKGEAGPRVDDDLSLSQSPRQQNPKPGRDIGAGGETGGGSGTV